MFSFTLFVYYFTVVSWVALATPQKPQQSLVSQSLLANQSTLDSYDTIQLRKLNYLGSSLSVYTKSLTTGDAIDYVVDGANGEKKIGNVFKNKLKECSSVLPSSPDEQKAVTRRPVVLDIGANAGIYGLYAGKMGCQTYFFEIQPVCIRNIYSSILINSMDGHASIIPFPVGNETNKVIELDESSHCFAIYRVSTGNQHEEYEKHQKVHCTFKTKSVRIDDVFHHAMQTSKLDTWVL